MTSDQDPPPGRLADMAGTDAQVTPGGMADSGTKPSGLALRLGLLRGSVVLLGGWVLGAGLLMLWIAAVPAAAVWAGIPATLWVTGLVRRLADWHRRWAAPRLGEPVARPYMPVPDGSWLVQVRVILRDPASWRDWAWLAVNSITWWFSCGLSLVFFLAGIFYLIFPVLYAVTPRQVFRSPLGFYQLHSVPESLSLVPLGLAFLLLWYLTSVRLANLNARLIRWLLAPTEHEALRMRVRQLAVSRAETVDTQASELRRIERDLHDGAQARLVSLGMSLGLAEELMTDDPQAAQRLLAEARQSTTSALGELRDLVRGIHPPVLADRGLDGAIRALALVSVVPATVVVDLPGRLPAAAESAAYFAVAEALANAIKHADPRHIRITLTLTRRDGGAAVLTMLVSDDGHGGARIDAGTGLRGIERRLAAFDGTLTIDSPAGGPTDVRMTLPCALS
jgi:signal transduction histidine kinase